MSGYRGRLSPRLEAAGVGLQRPAAQSGQTLGPGTAADINRLSIEPGQNTRQYRDGTRVSGPALASHHQSSPGCQL